MKFRKNLFVNFRTSAKMISVLWKIDKAYLFFVLADIIVQSCIPFISLFLTQRSIQMLENQVGFGAFVLTILGFIVVYCSANIIHDYFSYKTNLHGNNISLSLHNSLFQKTLSIDYEMLLDKEIQEKKNLAEKIVSQNRFSQVVNSFRNFIAKTITLVGLIVVLSQIDFLILAVTLVIVMVNLLITRYRNKYHRAIDVNINPLQRQVSYFVGISSSFSVIKEVKTYKMQKELINRYSDVRGKIYKELDKTVRLSFVGYIIAHVMNFSLDAVAYSYLGFRVIVQKTLSIANFSMFLNAIYNFSSCIETMLSSFESISANGQYLQDYFNFMSLKKINDTNDDEIQRVPQIGSFSFVFDNVSYKYPNQDNYALRNVSLEIKSNEKIALVGENGAGKTTLVMLLLRLLKPTEGEITLNGVDIWNYDEDEYWRIFSTIFQDFNLFSFTVCDNITALDNIDRLKLQNVISSAGLESKIESLNKGLETYIDKIYDNEGVLFSGGESQRLAIARALYKDAPIYILDEPTAALDPRIENEIYTKFKDITKGKTAVYITHRLASTQFCDRVIVMKNGGVEEIGSHRELMKNNGYYAELYDMQAKYYQENEDELMDNSQNL